MKILQIYNTLGGGKRGKQGRKKGRGAVEKITNYQ